jgi:hypothetical protein
MKGNEIVVNAEGKGRYVEGYLQTAAYPGTVCTILPGVNPQSGRFTYQPGLDNSAADNDPRQIAILDVDHDQGGTNTTQYQIPAGQTQVRAFFYIPLPGDELNVLVEGEQGTGSANAFTIGERLSVRASTGLAYKQSTSANKATFMSMEHIDEVPDTATLVFCEFQ